MYILKEMVLEFVCMFDGSWFFIKYWTGTSLQIVGC